MACAPRQREMGSPRARSPAHPYPRVPPERSLAGAVHALVQGWVRSQLALGSFVSYRQAVCSAVDAFIVELNTMTEPAAAHLRDAFKGLRSELSHHK